MNTAYAESWSHQEVARHLAHNADLRSEAHRIVAGPAARQYMANALLRLVMAHDIPGVDYTLVDYHTLVNGLLRDLFAQSPPFEVVGAFVFDEDGES